MTSNDSQVIKDLESRREMDLEELDRLASRFFLPACVGDPKAAAIYIKISERRAKLLGLDEAIKVKMEVSTYDVTELNRQFEILQRNSDGESSTELDQ